MTRVTRAYVTVEFSNGAVDTFTVEEVKRVELEQYVGYNLEYLRSPFPETKITIEGTVHRHDVKVNEVVVDGTVVKEIKPKLIEGR